MNTRFFTLFLSFSFLLLNGILGCSAQNVYPYVYEPYSKHDLVRVNLSGLRIKVFMDVQCSEYMMSQGRKSDGSLCVVSEEGPECRTTELVIVAPDGTIHDHLTGAVFGTNIIVKQFRIEKDGSIAVYTFIPETTERITIDECSFQTSKIIPGRIKTEVYKIEKDCFVLKKTVLNDSFELSCKERTQARSNLWDL